MGVAPSRETIRRGFFSVNQANSSSGGGGTNKRRDIILIPLTKEYFPSPDCPLFVQFHKARCDAAVNYYFRRPGNPGDLSCIPNYEGSYRGLGEETRAQRRRRRQLAREARAAHHSENKEGLSSRHDPAGVEKNEEDDVEENSEDEEDFGEDESYPSREALYHGVIERVEESLFDTDAEMRQAYQWTLAHPHTTMGPDGKKQRKVLPVLCAVAFRSDISKVHSLPSATTTTTAGNVRPTPSTSTPSHMSSSSIAMNNMQAALENGVYMFGSIVNIVGCFGFVSMQEDADDAQRMSHQQQQNLVGSSNATSSPLLTPGPMQSSFSSGSGGTYHHDPYSFTSRQTSSECIAGGGTNNSQTIMMASGGTLLSSRRKGRNGRHHVAKIGTAADLITLPPPVAAPLAAMVFLTKSAGEQNLGRVTHIAASTYYYQMIQAGLIERQTGVRMEGPNIYPSPTSATTTPRLPPYGSNLVAGQPAGSNVNMHNSTVGAASMPPPPPTYSGSSPSSPLGGSEPMPPTPQGPPKPFLPPMETFSFSSLLTNIPVLSFLYEMKWRWGYLGVLKTSTPNAGPSRNSSFNGSVPGHSMGSTTSAHGPGSMMGNHSTGGLAAIDRSAGQGVTDELEMWITVDQMIHGRISKHLAQRLCWSLAERPEVMQERIAQLPSEENGYWRYRGLTDQTHLPPIPEPGKVVTIHPKDVYVMGSDVLPGFNEGDILRFDPERLVWFADHSIPLEGLVLAAMRPYCKQAREADPEDPSWVTKVCDADEAEALQAGEADTLYPTPAPTADQAALLASDPNLVHIHEHVGNFYVYRFVRDGTTYYYGTVPNFANPNKKRQFPSAANCSSHGTPTSMAVTSLSSTNGGNSGHESVAAGVFSADNIGVPSPNATAKAVPSTNTNINTNTNKPVVPVPKTIASALFSLLPASRATAGKSSGSTTAGGSGGGAAHTSPSGTASNHNTNNNNSGGNVGSTITGNKENTSNASANITTTYLATPVTSNAMNTARRWVQAIYSYAYGAPNTAAATAAGGRRGPTAASLAVRSGNVSAGVSPGTPAAGPSSRATPVIAPLCNLSGEGINGIGSAPSTPVQAPHLNTKKATLGGSAAAAAFPNATPMTAYDVAVWPAPKLIGVANLAASHHVNAVASNLPVGTATPSTAPAMMSPGTPQLAAHHSRSSSQSLIHLANAKTTEEEGTAAAAADGPAVTSKPIKRYVEDGSYEWDWRKL